jgi:hypothetical protein
MGIGMFNRFIGIDYSGAQTPTASLKGLRIYLAEGNALPVEVSPPPSARKYWTRRGIAEWLVDRLSDDAPTLVGIDHGFSFPLRYFQLHGLKHDWPAFLDDFQRHWPTDEDISVDFVRDGLRGNGSARTGSALWRRLTEERAGGAKSVFHFDVQGQVAKSTHSGLPWLRFIRQQLQERVHFWPFEGWDIPEGRSAIAEVYPSLWRRSFANEGRSLTSTTPSASPRGCRKQTATVPQPKGRPRCATPAECAKNWWYRSPATKFNSLSRLRVVLCQLGQLGHDVVPRGARSSISDYQFGQRRRPPGRGLASSRSRGSRSASAMQSRGARLAK